MKAEYELIADQATKERRNRPDKPVFGFLYPAFSDRSSDDSKVDIFNADPSRPAEGMMYKIDNDDIPEIYIMPASRMEKEL